MCSDPYHSGITKPPLSLGVMFRSSVILPSLSMLWQAPLCGLAGLYPNPQSSFPVLQSAVSLWHARPLPMGLAATCPSVEGSPSCLDDSLHQGQNTTSTDVFVYMHFLQGRFLKFCKVPLKVDFLSPFTYMWCNFFLNSTSFY